MSDADIPRTLAVMREDMRAIARMTEDPEDLHMRADDLLIEALRYLAPMLPPKDPTLWPAETEDLIESFRRVRKWYA